MMIQDFRLLAEVVADSETRLHLRRAGVRPGDRFAAATNGEGQILLTPLAGVQDLARTDTQQSS